jgi:hypothetical protein
VTLILRYRIPLYLAAAGWASSIVLAVLFPQARLVLVAVATVVGTAALRWSTRIRVDRPRITISRWFGLSRRTYHLTDVVAVTIRRSRGNPSAAAALTFADGWLVAVSSLAHNFDGLVQYLGPMSWDKASYPTETRTEFQVILPLAGGAHRVENCTSEMIYNMYTDEIPLRFRGIGSRFERVRPNPTPAERAAMTADERLALSRQFIVRPISTAPLPRPTPDSTPFTVSYRWPLWLSVAIIPFGWSSLWIYADADTVHGAIGHPFNLIVLVTKLVVVIGVPTAGVVVFAQRVSVTDDRLTIWRLCRRTLRVPIVNLLQVVRYRGDNAVPGLKLMISGGHIIDVSGRAHNFRRLSTLLDGTLPPTKFVGTRR